MIRSDKTAGLLSAIVLALYSASLAAGNVDPANMTTFVPGAPAVAADVNANFDEHTTQINDNSARIDALGMRNTEYVTGYSVHDGRENGYVTGRSLTINKLSDTTDLRIHYTDAFRVVANSTGGKYCEWKIHVNGADCASTPLIYTVYEYAGGGYVDNHRLGTVAGYCQGLPAGSHNVSVYVASPSGTDCYTGYKTTYLLEAEEVN